jgi:hypothetical protein
VIETGHRQNDERYLKWFSWALLTLGRDLEAGHAAAEAACDAEAAGYPMAAVQSAARSAGSRPPLASPEQIALIEWAFWGQTSFEAEPSACLRAARLALAELESTHDVERAKNRMRATLGGESTTVTTTPAAPGGVTEPAVLPIQAPSVRSTPAATGVIDETAPAPETGQARNGRLPITAWLGVIAVVLVGVGIFSWVFVISPKLVPPPTISAAVVGGYVDATVYNYPSNHSVYFFVDNVADQATTTDGSGYASAFLLVTSGSHDIAGCRDSSGYDCPARSQVYVP